MQLSLLVESSSVCHPHTAVDYFLFLGSAMYALAHFLRKHITIWLKKIHFNCFTFNVIVRIFEAILTPLISVISPFHT